MGLEDRRPSLRDARRRRVLRDARSTDDGRATDLTNEARSSVSPYGDPAFLESTPRLIDIFPRRWSTSAITFLLVAVAIASQALLSIQTSRQTPPDDVVAGRWAEALTPGARGSLGDALGALMLTASAVASYGILSIRRHRQDDYQATYRIWGWMTTLCVLWSVNETARLHEMLRHGMNATTGATVFASGAGWWIAPAVLVGAAVAFRVFADMRDCRASTALLGGAIACYVVSLVLYVHAGVDAIDARASIAVDTLTLAGHGLSLISLLVFGRFVRLEAEGTIETPNRYERAERKARSAREEDVETRPSLLRAWIRVPFFLRRTSDPSTSSVDSRSTTTEARVPQMKEANTTSDDAPAGSRMAELKERLRRRRESQAVEDTPSTPSKSGSFKKSSTTSLAASPSINEDDVPDEVDGRPLSKAEKKALRRRLRKQQRGRS